MGVVRSAPFQQFCINSFSPTLAPILGQFCGNLETLSRGKGIMAFTVSHFSKRIVVLGFAPPLNKSSDVVRDSREIQIHIASSLGSTEAGIWCIYDFSDVELQFEHLSMMFVDQNRDKPGSFSDPRVQIVAIMNDPTLTAKLESFLNHSKMEMPIFRCFEEAINHVYQQVDVDTMLSSLNLC